MRALAFCFLLFPCAALAQFNSSVQGNVQDPSGAAVAGANVTLTNTDTNVKQTNKADDSGVYRFASLAPGNYQITAEAPGFAAKAIAVVLTTGETGNVPVTLGVGGNSTQVEVSAQAPLLDTSDSRNQLTIDREALNSLPLPSRNPLALVTLTPGVTGIGSGSATNFNPENAVDASANGRGSNGNLYVVDGLDVTSSIRPGVVNLTPNADSVQEASVQTNVYSVDYGRASSIETLITTRSGTDQFHGFASDFYTYQDFFARGEFGLPSQDKVSPYHTNNFSLGVGGPVIPNHRFFFFAGFEPYRAILSTGNAVQVFEDPAFLAFANSVQPNSPGTGLLNTYKPTNATFTNVQQTAAQAFGASNPAGNTGCGTPSTDNIPCTLPVFDQGNFNSSSYNNANQYNVRVDKTFNKDRVYGLFYRDTINTGAPAVRPAFNTKDNYYTFSLQGNETHTFTPDTLNEGFAGYNRIEGFAPSSGLFTVPVVNVTGLGVGFGTGFALGDYVQHSYHWRDVLTHIQGSHDIRVGYEGFHGDDIANFAAAYGQPTLQFNSLIDLINNDPYTETGLSYNPLTGQPQAHNYAFEQTTGGAFAEDTWKASKQLTVNYGIRYDNYGNAYPKSGTILANFHLAQSSNFQQQVANGVLTPQSHVFNHDLNYVFSPRAGFAYAPGESEKWLVHGGVGLYHDYFTLGNSENALSGNPPSYITPTFYNNGSTAAPIFSFGTQNTYPFGFQYPQFGGNPLNSKGGFVGSQATIGGTAENLASPFTINFSLAVDRQITPDFVVSVGYVGSHSGNLVVGGGNVANTAYGVDVNSFQGDLIQHLSCTENATTNSCSGVQTRLNTSFGAINYAFNGAISNYSGLVVSTRGRFARSAFLTASYTHSRSEDDWQNYPTAVPFFQYYAISPYDVPNRFTLGVSYDLPSPVHSNGFAKRTLGGWSLAGITVLQSGQPFTVYNGAAFAAQLINPALGMVPGNIQYAPGSGDYNADGNNTDYPGIASYHQKHSRSAYLPKNGGVFGGCPGGVLPCGNGDFVLPAFGTEGDETPDQFRNAGYADTDVTVKKNIALAERFALELRLDAFNVFNRVNLVNSGSSVTSGAGLTTQPGLDTNLQDGAFGQAQSTYSPRNLLISARLNF